MGEVTRYTLAEVAARDGRKTNEMWMVYRDSVYNVTNYALEHPGGFDTIQEEAGKDGTKAFDDGHSSDARKILAKLKIGEIVEEEKKYDANGKKKKRVVKAAPEEHARSCINIITCGLLG